MTYQEILEQEHTSRQTECNPLSLLSHKPPMTASQAAEGEGTYAVYCARKGWPQARYHAANAATWAFIANPELREL